MFYRLKEEAKEYKKKYATVYDVINDINNFSDNYYSLFYWMYSKLRYIVSQPYPEWGGVYYYHHLENREEIEEIVHEAFVKVMMEFHLCIWTHDIETAEHLQNRIADRIRYFAVNEVRKELQRLAKVTPFSSKSKSVRKIQLPENKEFDEDKIILDTMIDEYLKQCSKMEELIFLNMVKKADYNYDKHQGKLLTEQKIAELSGVCYTTVRNKKQKVKREFKDLWTGKKTSQQAG